MTTHRTPSAQAPDPIRDDLDPDVDRPWDFSDGPLGPNVSRAMRTVDPVRPTDRDSSELEYLIERADWILDEIETAARARPFRMGRVTGLAFTNSRNAITGKRATIVRRWFRNDGYSSPFAELLAYPESPIHEVRASADAFTRNAANGFLEIAVKDRPEKGHPDPLLFAVISFEEDPEHCYFLARLLVRPREAAQWADALVEARGGRLH